MNATVVRSAGVLSQSYAPIGPCGGSTLANVTNSTQSMIRDHGIIEPVVINQHGVIICGHQRVRACQEIGITDVPVVVREVASDEEHETLLIEENLRRRQLLPSESFKAVKRLYELRGLDGVKGGPADNRSTVEQLAKELGKSQTTVKTMRTLADLIPPLATMLDAGTIKERARRMIGTNVPAQENQEPPTDKPGHTGHKCAR